VSASILYKAASVHVYVPNGRPHRAASLLALDGHGEVIFAEKPRDARVPGAVGSLSVSASCERRSLFELRQLVVLRHYA